MKLTLKIKLIPTAEQAGILLQTIKEVNEACNLISCIAWDNKVFQQFKLHHASYYAAKDVAINLNSQLIIRGISKVSDSYKLDRKVKRIFKPLGSVSYDNRILAYRPNTTVSICCIGGRIKIPFVCHNPNYIQYIKGESSLIYRKEKFYIFQTIEIPEEDIKEVHEFIGCDFGQVDICMLSDGTNYSSEQLKKVRKKYSKVRASVQSKGTKGAKKLLKRLSGRERRFVFVNNHTISKRIVAKAIAESKGIAIEDLSHIRKTAKPKSKAQKTELNKWSFYELRRFMTYKAKLSGVKLFAVPPAYTSQMCSDCLHIGKRTGKNFSCENCGNTADADHNAAKNIATWGQVINCPEKSSILYNFVHNYQV